MKLSSIEKLHEESSELMHKHLKGELSARDLIVMHHNLYYDAQEMHKQEMISNVVSRSNALSDLMDFALDVCPNERCGELADIIGRI